MKILCVCLSTSVQKTLNFDKFTPTCVNRSLSFIENAGGKAINTARILNQLEPKSAKIICPIGTNNKERFLSLIKKDDLDFDFIEIPGATRECWTILEKNGRTTEIIADEKPIDSEKFKTSGYDLLLIKKVQEEIKNCGALVLAGSCPTHWGKTFLAQIAECAKAKNKPVVADFKGENLTKTILAMENSSADFFVKINRQEFEQTFLCSLKRGIKNISLKNPFVTFIVTNGKKSTVLAKNGKIQSFCTQKLKPVNTTACGDAFNAGFIFEYLKSKDIKKAVEVGTTCASKNAVTQTPGSLF